MNHDITHCIGIKRDHVCSICYRREAHEDLLRLVQRGKLESGKMHSYLNAEGCVEEGYSMLWVKPAK